MKPRYWHTDWYVLAALLIFGIADFIYLRNVGELPDLKDIWWLAIIVPSLCGAGVTLGCAGAILWKRIVAAAVCGCLVGALYTAFSTILGHSSGITIANIAAVCASRIFVFAIIAIIGAIITELKLPEPKSS